VIEVDKNDEIFNEILKANGKLTKIASVSDGSKCAGGGGKLFKIDNKDKPKILKNFKNEDGVSIEQSQSQNQQPTQLVQEIYKSLS